MKKNVKDLLVTRGMYCKSTVCDCLNAEVNQLWGKINNHFNSTVQDDEYFVPAIKSWSTT